MTEDRPLNPKSCESPKTLGDGLVGFSTLLLGERLWTWLGLRAGNTKVGVLGLGPRV